MAPKAILAYALGVLVFLGWFAWRFAPERLYSDSGYYLFHVVNEGGFHIEHGRWVLALSQLLPWLGVKLGLPLSQLIVLHSLNNVIFLMLSLVFVIGVLKDLRSGLALSAIHLVGLTHGLFCPIFELYYGVALIVVFRAVLRKERLAAPWRWGLLSVLFLGILSSHFLGVLLVLGVLFIDRSWRDRRLFILLMVLFLAHLAWHSLTMSAYERERLGFIDPLGRPTQLLDLFSLERLLALGGYLLRKYPDLLAVVLFCVAALWRNKRRWELLVFHVVLLVLYVLIGLYHPDLGYDRYSEQLNFAFAAWVVLVLCHPELRPPRGPIPVLTLIVLATLFRMAEAVRVAPFYEARTAWHRDRIEQAHDLSLTKGIVRADLEFGTPHDHVDMSWSTSVESLLLSSCSGPERTVSLITDWDVQFEDVSTKLDSFIFRRWDVMDPAALDRVYFTPPEGRYVLME